MILIYLALMVVLGVIQWLTRLRAGRLERRYCKAATDAETYLKQTHVRGGNNNRPDPFVAARQQFELARLAMCRDRLETRYGLWQRRSEHLAGVTRWLSNYRGKVLPYLLGVVDVALVLVAVTYLGISADDVRELLQR